MSGSTSTRIVLLSLLALGACKPNTNTGSQSASAVAQIFAELEREGSFNGAVVVAEDGRVIYKRAFGVSDIESGVMLHEQSGFEIASVSKTFTAIAIHQLVERGRLSYDDALPTFFPELPYSGVTIAGLLSHTSGLFDVYGRPELRERFFQFYGKTEPPYSNSDYLAFLEAYKPSLDNEPLVEDSYSNTGYVLLGLIVEKISEEEFDEFLRKNIFEPSGMTNTFVFSKMDPHEVPEFVKGHRVGNDSNILRTPAPDAPPRMRGLTFGDDDMVSTLDDMLAFDQALRSGRLLEPETLEHALTPVVLRDGRTAEHGLGFAIQTVEGRQYASHGGSTTGFWSFCQFSTMDNDNTVVLFTNVTGPQRRLGPIYNSIRDVLAREPSSQD